MITDDESGRNFDNFPHCKKCKGKTNNNLIFDIRVLRVRGCRGPSLEPVVCKRLQMKGFDWENSDVLYRCLLLGVVTHGGLIKVLVVFNEDCEQSLFFFRINEGSPRARKR